MASVEDRILRVLIVHGEARTREALEQTVRRVCFDRLAVFHASSLTEGMHLARQLDPGCVLFDLGEQPALALELARDVQAPGRLTIGLYNALVRQQNDVEFVRRAVRAGVTDFVPLPASDAEVEAALARRHLGPGADRAGRTAAFVSHKGGVGTTTLAVNSALALAATHAEESVVLCDAVLQFGGVAAALDLTPNRDLADVVRDLPQINDFSSYLMQEPQSGLRVLPAPRGLHEAEAIAPDDLSQTLVRLRRTVDFVVVDLPPVVDLMTLAVLDLCDSIFVVTEAIAPTVVNTARFLAMLGEQGFEADRMHLVVNRYRTTTANLSQEVVTKELGRAAVAYVDYDEGVILAENQGSPLWQSNRRSQFSQAIQRLIDVTVNGAVAQSALGNRVA